MNLTFHPPFNRRRWQILLGLLLCSLARAQAATGDSPTDRAPNSEPAALTDGAISTNRLDDLDDAGTNSANLDASQTNALSATNSFAWSSTNASHATNRSAAAFAARASRRAGASSAERMASADVASGATDSRSSSSTNGLEYSNFKIVTERNIFNPNRSPRRRGGPEPKPRTIESFSLVGIMSYEKGTFAFFDGTSSSFKKVLKVSDKIAGYTINDIDASKVQLSAGTNQLELKIGGQVRREDEGAWQLSNQADSYASAPSSSGASSSAAPSGAESDVLKKLMQRREQE